MHTMLTNVAWLLKVLQNSEPTLIIQYIAENVNEAAHKLKARLFKCSELKSPLKIALRKSLFAVDYHAILAIPSLKKEKTCLPN